MSRTAGKRQAYSMSSVRKPAEGRQWIRRLAAQTGESVFAQNPTNLDRTAGLEKCWTGHRQHRKIYPTRRSRIAITPQQIRRNSFVSRTRPALLLENQTQTGLSRLSAVFYGFGRQFRCWQLFAERQRSNPCWCAVRLQPTFLLAHNSNLHGKGCQTSYQTLRCAADPGPQILSF